MNLIACILAALAGIWLFSMREPALIGAALGVIVALLWRQQGLLRQRITQLEARLKARPSEQPAPKEVAPRRRAEEETPDFAFETAPKAGAPPQAERPPLPTELPATAPAPRTRPAAPVKPPAREPQIELWNIVVSYFTGGNVVVRAGVVVLFFGVAFLLKYSAERNLVPIEFRLLGVAAGAVAMLLFGWRLRLRRTGYALLLQGGAVGVLYLTIFAALRLYQLLPTGLALGLLVAMSFCSAALAILQDARVLAVVGILGGFLAPILTSTGSGSHVMLFSYYALLNAGILLTARHRSWRELNLLGFAFTFGIGTLWGSQNYTPELFASTEPFLLFFFFLYLTIGILFARNLPLPQKGFIDGTLVFGTPIVCFALQVKLVDPYPNGLAWSALALGLIYASLAWGLFRKGSPAMRTLVESFLALGVIFGTVAIPLALDGRWTATAWTLEGAAIVWIALKQQRWMPRLFGLVLQVLAGGALLQTMDQPSAQLLLLNSFCLGALLVALAGLFSGGCLYRHRETFASALLESRLMLTWGLLWWFGAWFHEIDRFAPDAYRLALLLLLVSVSSVVAFHGGRRLRWADLTQVYLGLLAVMLGGAAWSIAEGYSHPSLHGGWAAWPLAFACHYRLLYRDEDGPLARCHDWLHMGLLWLLMGQCSWEAAWWTEHWVHGSGVWSLVVLAAVPALFMLALCRCWDLLLWPLTGRQRTYLYHALAPVGLYLWLGSLAVNSTNRGNPWPLPYLPLLNPLDVTQAGVLLALGWWLHVLGAKLEIRPFGLQRRTLVILGGGTLFFWLNAVLIRTLHYWGRVPFHLPAMIRSDLVQTALSIFWTLSAMLIMFWGTRRAYRPAWMCGAGLIGVVMVKLFAFDLANTSTVERIVSFIGVGVLCLAIGYLAPLPARADAAGGAE